MRLSFRGWGWALMLGAGWREQGEGRGWLTVGFGGAFFGGKGLQRGRRIWGSGEALGDAWRSHARSSYGNTVLFKASSRWPQRLGNSLPIAELEARDPGATGLS